MTKIRIIDAHAHVGPWKLPGLELLSCTMEDVVHLADKEGLDGLVVTRSDGGHNRDLRTAIARTSSPALWFVPWIRPGSTDATRLLDEPGPRVAGFKLHPSVDRMPVNDPAYDPVFRAAAEARLPVLIHTGRWQEVAGFGLALERARKHPNVKLIFAHAGGNEFGLRRKCCSAIAEQELTNVSLDLTGLGMPLFSRRLVDQLGADRFLFGSDFPLGHPRVQLAHMTAMELPRLEEAAILGANAQALFGAPSNRQPA